MTRTTAKLAAIKVTAVLKAGDKRSYADGGNLYLQVTGSGTGSWLFRYAEKGSGVKGSKPRTHWLGLGSANTVSLSLAREKAKTLRAEILAGIDPAAKRQEEKSAPRGRSHSLRSPTYILLPRSRDGAAQFMPGSGVQVFATMQLRFSGPCPSRKSRPGMSCRCWKKFGLQKPKPPPASANGSRQSWIMPKVAVGGVARTRRAGKGICPTCLPQKNASPLWCIIRR